MLTYPVGYDRGESPIMEIPGNNGNKDQIRPTGNTGIHPDAGFRRDPEKGVLRGRLGAGGGGLDAGQFALSGAGGRAGQGKKGAGGTRPGVSSARSFYSDPPAAQPDSEPLEGADGSSTTIHSSDSPSVVAKKKKKKLKKRGKKMNAGQKMKLVAVKRKAGTGEKKITITAPSGKQCEISPTMYEKLKKSGQDDEQIVTQTLAATAKAAKAGYPSPPSTYYGASSTSDFLYFPEENSSGAGSSSAADGAPPKRASGSGKASLQNTSEEFYPPSPFYPPPHHTKGIKFQCGIKIPRWQCVSSVGSCGGWFVRIKFTNAMMSGVSAADIFSVCDVGRRIKDGDKIPSPYKNLPETKTPTTTGAFTKRIPPSTWMRTVPRASIPATFPGATTVRMTRPRIPTRVSPRIRLARASAAIKRVP